VLELLDGTPITAAPILIQARTVSRKGEVVSERTLSETTIDSTGTWSVDVPPARPGIRGLWLRTLCTGAPGVGACVSDPLHLGASEQPAQRQDVPAPDTALQTRR
jgi:hypothetical protein